MPLSESWRTRRKPTSSYLGFHLRLPLWLTYVDSCRKWKTFESITQRQAALDYGAYVDSEGCLGVREGIH